MTPSEFDTFLRQHGLTVRGAAALLGVAPSTVQDWRTGANRRTGASINPPDMLGLACAAIARGLAPWAEESEPERSASAR